ncbi:hypothetical protein H696_01907 [Fonticula alba]|uniref:PH domain-containing protein n=1 Tax=Fonticula alba TaxID=691883 RepID=A0A058Z9Q7_FONAL|nr:hypothetical protein H696_01907 [Fonticula alba]KCV70960.1 hypothetical protein H696_01907 [Fonticula alba]|eukprot:XP_009494083.1 hypothetical protein H696_01907 [Fonticula alba]
MSLSISTAPLSPGSSSSPTTPGAAVAATGSPFPDSVTSPLLARPPFPHTPHRHDSESEDEVVPMTHQPFLPRGNVSNLFRKVNSLPEWCAVSPAVANTFSELADRSLDSLMRTAAELDLATISAPPMPQALGSASSPPVIAAVASPLMVALAKLIPPDDSRLLYDADQHAHRLRAAGTPMSGLSVNPDVLRRTAGEYDIGWMVKPNPVHRSDHPGAPPNAEAADAVLALVCACLESVLLKLIRVIETNVSPSARGPACGAESSSGHIMITSELVTDTLSSRTEMKALFARPHDAAAGDNTVILKVQVFTPVNPGAGAGPTASGPAPTLASQAGSNASLGSMSSMLGATASAAAQSLLTIRFNNDEIIGDAISQLKRKLGPALLGGGMTTSPAQLDDLAYCFYVPNLTNPAARHDAGMPDTRRFSTLSSVSGAALAAAHAEANATPKDQLDYGYFLDPKKSFSEYPGIRNNTVVEFRPDSRILTVLLNENSIKEFRVAETAPIEDILKTIAATIGLVNTSRFGLIIGRTADDMYGGSRNYHAGDGASPTPGTPAAAPAGNAGTLRMKSRRHTSALHLFGTMGRSQAGENKRPSLDSAFGGPGAGGAGAGDQGAGDDDSQFSRRSSTGSYLTMPNRGSAGNKGTLTKKTSLLAAAMTNVNVQLSLSDDGDSFIETTDRSEYLSLSHTLRGQGCPDSDLILLLVRQKMMQSFSERAEEGPGKLADELRRRAEELEREFSKLVSEAEPLTIEGVVPGGMGDGSSHQSAVEGESESSMDQFGRSGGRQRSNNSLTLDTEVEQWIPLQSSSGDSTPGHLAYEPGDRVTVLKKDPSSKRWYGSLRGEFGWFDSSLGTVFVPPVGGPSSPVVTSVASSTGLASFDGGPAGSSSTLSLYSNGAGGGGPGGAGAGAGPVRLEGILAKRGQSFGRWQRARYLLRGGSVWYYKGETVSGDPDGSFSIRGALVTQHDDIPKRPNVFSITLPDASGSVTSANAKQRFFQTDTPAELAAWVAILTEESAAGGAAH